MVAFAEPFVTAFVLALLSEIADKTQLVILGLALKFKAPAKVFFGALGAHAFMDGIAIVLGTAFGFSISLNLVKNITGMLFIALGSWAAAKIFIIKSKKEKERIASINPLLSLFLIVLASEFGDKTQIASGLLAAKYLVPFSIFFGFLLALVIIIGLNVFIGGKVAERMPRKTIKILTAVLFILFGIFTLIA